MTYLERVREALKSIDHKSKGDRYSQTRERDSLQLELQASIADELKRIADALILQSGRITTTPSIPLGNTWSAETPNRPGTSSSRLMGPR